MITIRYWNTDKQQWAYVRFATIEDKEEYEVEHDIEFTDDQVFKG